MDLVGRDFLLNPETLTEAPVHAVAVGSAPIPLLLRALLVINQATGTILLELLRIIFIASDLVLADAALL